MRFYIHFKSCDIDVTIKMFLFVPMNFINFVQHMACSSVCLFHDRRYSSNIQRILNLLRINIIKIKYDLNTIGKKSLCTCSLTDDQLAITDEELNKNTKRIRKNQIKSDNSSSMARRN